MFIKNFFKKKNKESNQMVTNNEIHTGVINTIRNRDMRILNDLAIKMGLNVPKEIQREIYRKD
nr:MAG TPA: hypothetical protein [Bacteriophage sp.]